MCFLGPAHTGEEEPASPGCFRRLTQTSSALMPAMVSGPAAASDAGVLPPVSVPWRRLQTASKNPGWSSGQDLAPGGAANLLGSAPNSTPLQQPPNPEDPRQSRPPCPSTPLPDTPHRPRPSPTLTCFPAQPPTPPPALPPPQPKLAPQHGQAPSLRPWAPLLAGLHLHVAPGNQPDTRSARVSPDSSPGRTYPSPGVLPLTRSSQAAPPGTTRKESTHRPRMTVLRATSEPLPSPSNHSGLCMCADRRRTPHKALWLLKPPPPAPGSHLSRPRRPHTRSTAPEGARHSTPWVWPGELGRDRLPAEPGGDGKQV